MFLFLGLCYLTQMIVFRFISLPVSFIISLFLVHCVNKLYSYYPFISGQMSSLFPFPAHCEQSSKGHRRANISVVDSTEPFGYITKSGRTGSCRRQFFFNFLLLSYWLHHYAFPTEINKCSPFSPTMPAFVIILFVCLFLATLTRIR